MTRLLIALPFAFHAWRALTGLFMAAVPRNHPRRELLLLLLVMAGFATDLVDGGVARAIGTVHWESLYWSDHGADVLFWVGALAVIAGRLSFAKDVPAVERVSDRTPVPPWRRRLAFAGWLTLVLTLGAGMYWLMMERMFRRL